MIDKTNCLQGMVVDADGSKLRSIDVTMISNVNTSLKCYKGGALKVLKAVCARKCRYNWSILHSRPETAKYFLWTSIGSIDYNHCVCNVSEKKWIKLNLKIKNNLKIECSAYAKFRSTIRTEYKKVFGITIPPLCNQSILFSSKQATVWIWPFGPSQQPIFTSACALGVKVNNVYISLCSRSHSQQSFFTPIYALWVKVNSQSLHRSNLYESRSTMFTFLL